MDATVRVSELGSASSQARDLYCTSMPSVAAPIATFYRTA